MEEIKKSVMPESLWAENPKFAQTCQDIYDYMEKTPFNKAFPNKYKALTKDDAKKKTYHLFLKEPNMPLKTVVSTVLNDLDDDLSADLVREMTHNIIEKWEQLTAAAYANTHVEA
jgi:hypothetical protein